MKIFVGLFVLTLALPATTNTGQALVIVTTDTGSQIMIVSHEYDAWSDCHGLGGTCITLPPTLRSSGN